LIGARPVLGSRAAVPGRDALADALVDALVDLAAEPARLGGRDSAAPARAVEPGADALGVAGWAVSPAATDGDGAEVRRESLLRRLAI